MTSLLMRYCLAFTIFGSLMLSLTGCSNNNRSGFYDPKDPIIPPSNTPPIESSTPETPKIPIELSTPGTLEQPEISDPETSDKNQSTEVNNPITEIIGKPTEPDPNTAEETHNTERIEEPAPLIKLDEAPSTSAPTTEKDLPDPAHTLELPDDQNL